MPFMISIEFVFLSQEGLFATDKVSMISWEENWWLCVNRHQITKTANLIYEITIIYSVVWCVLLIFYPQMLHELARVTNWLLSLTVLFTTLSFLLDYLNYVPDRLTHSWYIIFLIQNLKKKIVKIITEWNWLNKNSYPD